MTPRLHHLKLPAIPFVPGSVCCSVCCRERERQAPYSPSLVVWCVGSHNIGCQNIYMKWHCVYMKQCVYEMAPFRVSKCIYVKFCTSCWWLGRHRWCVAVCAECCSVLQCVAVCCSVFVIVFWYITCHNSVLQCVAVCCSVLQCDAVCCSVLQCVAVCCSVWQCVCNSLLVYYMS